MFSLWDDASRDAEAEDKIRRTAMAESELDRGVFSFVALSKTSSEYEHRKALVEERIHQVAELTGNTFSDVVRILDGKMSYILEAARLPDGKGFILIDPDGKKVGGPFSDRNIAEKAKKKAEPGTRIVSMSKKDDDLPDFLKDKKDKDEGDDEDSEKDDEDKEESEDEDEKDDNKKESSLNRAMRMIRTALENEVDPIEWVGDLPASSTPEAVPSEHNEDSDPKANLPGGNIPETPENGLDHSGWMDDRKEANAGGLMNTLTNVGDSVKNAIPGMGGAGGGMAANTPGPSPTSAPAPGTGPELPAEGPVGGSPASGIGELAQGMSEGLGGSGLGVNDINNHVSDTVRGLGGLNSTIQRVRQTVARYNPHLSPKRVDEVARKVAVRYLEG